MPLHSKVTACQDHTSFLTDTKSAAYQNLYHKNNILLKTKHICSPCTTILNTATMEINIQQLFQ